MSSSQYPSILLLSLLPSGSCAPATIEVGVSSDKPLSVRMGPDGAARGASFQRSIWVYPDEVVVTFDFASTDVVDEWGGPLEASAVVSGGEEVESCTFPVALPPLSLFPGDSCPLPRVAAWIDGRRVDDGAESATIVEVARARVRLFRAGDSEPEKLTSHSTEPLELRGLHPEEGLLADLGTPNALASLERGVIGLFWEDHVAILDSAGRRELPTVPWEGPVLAAIGAGDRFVVSAWHLGVPGSVEYFVVTLDLAIRSIRLTGPGLEGRAYRAKSFRPIRDGRFLTMGELGDDDHALAATTAALLVCELANDNLSCESLLGRGTPGVTRTSGEAVGGALIGETSAMITAAGELTLGPFRDGSYWSEPTQIVGPGLLGSIGRTLTGCYLRGVWTTSISVDRFSGIVRHEPSGVVGMCSGNIELPDRVRYYYSGTTGVEVFEDGRVSTFVDARLSAAPFAHSSVRSAPGGGLLVTTPGGPGLVVDERGVRTHLYGPHTAAESEIYAAGANGEIAALVTDPPNRLFFARAEGPVEERPLLGIEGRVAGVAFDSATGEWVAVGMSSDRFGTIHRIEAQTGRARLIWTSPAGAFIDVDDVAPGVLVAAGDLGSVVVVRGDQVRPVQVEWDDPGTLETEGPPSPPYEGELLPEAIAFGMGDLSFAAVDGEGGVGWMVARKAHVVRVQALLPEPRAVRVSIPIELAQISRHLARSELVPLTAVRAFSPRHALVLARNKSFGERDIAYALEAWSERAPSSEVRWEQMGYELPDRRLGALISVLDVFGSRSSLAILHYNSAKPFGHIDRVGASNRVAILTDPPVAAARLDDGTLVLSTAGGMIVRSR